MPILAVTRRREHLPHQQPHEHRSEHAELGGDELEQTIGMKQVTIELRDLGGMAETDEVVLRVPPQVRRNDRGGDQQSRPQPGIQQPVALRAIGQQVGQQPDCQHPHAVFAQQPQTRGQAGTQPPPPAPITGRLDKQQDRQRPEEHQRRVGGDEQRVETDDRHAGERDTRPYAAAFVVEVATDRIHDECGQRVQDDRARVHRQFR